MLHPRMDAYCLQECTWALCDARWAWGLACHPLPPRNPWTWVPSWTSVPTHWGVFFGTTAQVGFTACGTGSKLWLPAVHEPTCCTPVGSP